MTTSHLTVQCVSSLTEQQSKAEQLSILNDFVVHGEHNYILQITDTVVQLVPENTKLHGPVLVDFLGGANSHRQQFGGAELIAKACGLQNRKPKHILDCTAGLGRDAFVLSNRCQSFGTLLTLCEENPIVAALLADGLRRAQADSGLSPAIANLNLEPLNAIAHLMASPVEYDVIYMDPMFPERKKSAAIKKEMQALQAVVGHVDHEQHDIDLLNLARTKAKHRVVVKRPTQAPHIGDQKPQIEYSGKAIRFDVYTA